MGTIKSTIALYDSFSAPLMGITNAMNASMPIMDQMYDKLNRPIATNTYGAIQAQIDGVAASAQALNNELNSVSSPSISYNPETGFSGMDVPVTPIVTEQPQIDVPEQIDIPVNATVTEQPTLDVPNGVDIPVTPIVTEQPQIDVPDALDVPVTPIVTEQPQIDVPEQIDIPVNATVTDLDNSSVKEYTDEINALSDMLNRITAVQNTINQQSALISVLPDGVDAEISEITQKIQIMGQSLNQIKENPFNLDAEAQRLQIVELNNSITETIQRQSELNNKLNELPTPEIKWESDSLPVFTNTGIERYNDEVQSLNTILNTLNNTQNQIATSAANTKIFPANMVADMGGIQSRLQAIQQRIEQIENNPINVGSERANAELEQLRSQLSGAFSEQEALNSAVNRMDVGAANEAYLKLSNIIGSTEREIRDNVGEQGRFNDEIRKGSNEASKLKTMIAGAVGTFFGISAIRGFVGSSLGAFDEQLNAGNQLVSVLANMLDEDYVAQFEIETSADVSGALNEINSIQNSVDEVVVPVSAETRALTTAYNKIIDKASEIQGSGIYGDETMIAAAAEFSTYFTDTDAITMMMDTLSDYAMGMSGGGEIDTQTMVDYATNLGKIMSGAYDAMTKKGFEFNDIQKAIIEGEASRDQIVAQLGEEYADMSSDMQAAATITQIIDEAWAGLYENMSNTPEGRIISLNNQWGDMKEIIGERVYPYVMLFVDAIINNWGTIESIVGGLTTAFSILLGVLSLIAQGALTAANAIANNWSWIAPIIGGVISALAVYYGWMLTVNAIEAISKGIKIALAIAEYAHAAATGAEVSATAAATAAQYGLNTALLACPLTWIIILVIALIAVFYAAVAAVNHFAGTSVSATGIIMGALATAGAFIWDLILGVFELVLGVINYLVNPILAFVNFFANVFNDPIGSIIHLFGDLADNVLAVLQKIASAMDFVFGSHMADTVQGWRDDLATKVENSAKEYGNGEYEEVVSALDLSVEDLGLSRIAYSDAWDAGYGFGEGIDESISNFDPASLFGVEGIPTADDFANGYFDGIGTGIDSIAGDTASIADDMDISEEELKYLRDIAEQETINRFTTAEIHIDQTNNNNINSAMDIDGVVDGLTDAVNEAVEIIAEGVHA